MPLYLTWLVYLVASPLVRSLRHHTAKSAKMAPPRTAVAPYVKDEKVLCFHHEMLYEAKILEVQQSEDAHFLYRIHYKGWKNTWDDWVPQDRIRKLNDENRELALQLMQQAKASQQKSSKPAKKAALKNGSDFSSARGSEERTGGGNTMSSRGPRRARDYDLEHVSTHISYCIYFPFPIVALCTALESKMWKWWKGKEIPGELASGQCQSGQQHLGYYAGIWLLLCPNLLNRLHW